MHPDTAPRGPATVPSREESAVTACQNWAARASATDGSSELSEQRALSFAQDAGLDPAFKLFFVDRATAVRLSNEAHPPEGGMNLSVAEGYIAALKAVRANCASVGVSFGR